MTVEGNEFGYTKGSYEPLKVGKYDAVLHAIIGLGRQKGGMYKGKQKPPVIKLKFVFELPGSLRKTEDDEEVTDVIGKNVNISDNVERGGFAAMLKALGENPTSTNITKYMTKAALEKLLGKKVVLSIDHFETEDGDRPYVKEVFELDPRIQPQPEATKKFLYFNPRTPDLEAFKNTITPYTRKIMMEALDADQFPKELHEAYAVIKEQEAADGRSSNKEEEAPWEGSTEAIE